MLNYWCSMDTNHLELGVVALKEESACIGSTTGVMPI
uniref:Uncharacterized protein n=1 Tax=Picea glauca TaxID=3330 RepID=A0A124GNV3_PICGL|nr:hypothetical protein ABT39_MTgene3231 [Picea glauca]